MNYDNDEYITARKEQNVLEGDPQPTPGLPRAFQESKHSQDMYMERKAMKGMDRGYAGSKYHPRG